ncbi:hypothetical protein BGE01nite_17010 [Brevifollis gellanilyticus]|uniref:Uncharacterized protein n=1 Tax=Brevifollis gellanilyticus TaxID=748831 RepID=A0A512M6P5_9BACT|nr:hypothetical protein BGE01nite_17010 [Brevifollis gellanilyticus]
MQNDQSLHIFKVQMGGIPNGFLKGACLLNGMLSFSSFGQLADKNCYMTKFGPDVRYVCNQRVPMLYK